MKDEHWLAIELTFKEDFIVLNLWDWDVLDNEISWLGVVEINF